MKWWTDIFTIPNTRARRDSTFLNRTWIDNYSRFEFKKDSGGHSNNPIEFDHLISISCTIIFIISRREDWFVIYVPRIVIPQSMSEIQILNSGSTSPKLYSHLNKSFNLNNKTLYPSPLFLNFRQVLHIPRAERYTFPGTGFALKKDIIYQPPSITTRILILRLNLQCAVYIVFIILINRFIFNIII